MDDASRGIACEAKFAFRPGTRGMKNFFVVIVAILAATMSLHAASADNASKAHAAMPVRAGPDSISMAVSAMAPGRPGRQGLAWACRHRLRLSVRVAYRCRAFWRLRLLKPEGHHPGSESIPCGRNQTDLAPGQLAHVSVG